ncbi:hypothetical protein DB346_21595 [Verrucomicrobia bacterium LW23]|nr:hypothetical protein DB346_21595 [Verrucomicrobia bacterium LW23]
MAKSILFYPFIFVVLLLYTAFVYERKASHDRAIESSMKSAQTFFTDNPTAVTLPELEKKARSSQGGVENVNADGLPTSNEQPAATPGTSPGSAIVYDDKAFDEKGFNGNAPSVSPSLPASPPAGADQLPASNDAPAGGGEMLPASSSDTAGQPGAAPSLTDLLPGAPNNSGVRTASSSDHMPGAVGSAAPAPGVEAPASAPGGTEGAAPAGGDTMQPATSTDSGAVPLPPTDPGAAPGTMALNPGGAMADNPVHVLCYYQVVNASSTTNVYAITSKALETQMAYLKKNGYTVVSFADFQKYVRKELVLPPKSVLITVDGGFRNAVTVAKPIFARYNYPWTFFVYTDFVGADEDKVSWKDLADLEATGLVDVQSHSKSPSNLTMRDKKGAADYDAWVASELSESKRVLEEKLNKKVTALAYPYGDYNADIQQKAMAAGYEFLLGVSENPIDSHTQPNDISRIAIYKPTEKQFEAIMKSAPLQVAEVTPAPGQIVPERRPSISLVANTPFTPKTLKATLDGDEIKASYDPSTRRVILPVDKDLALGTIKVELTAQDTTIKQNYVYNWQFSVQKPAPADEAPKPTAEKTSAKKKPKTEKKPKRE